MGIIRDLRRWGVRTAWWNFRFNLGYRIGGFTAAEKPVEEMKGPS